MGRKKSQNPKKKVPFVRSHLRKWLDDINHKKFEFDEIAELSSNSESGSDNETIESDLKELQRPLKQLLRYHQDSAIKKSINIECEWLKCSYETNDEACFISHVHQHCQDLNDEDFSTEVECSWDLCHFETKDIAELKRHVDYHSYHSRLKSFGYGLGTLIPIPLCQHDSKGRNKIPDNIGTYFCYWDNCTEKYEKFHEFIEHVNHHISLIIPNVVEDEHTIRIIDNKKINEIKVDCKWEGCERQIYNIHELKRHVKNKHTKERMIACANCGMIFICKPSFVDHFVRQTVSGRNFQCRDCFKYYPSEKLLKEHSRGHVNKFQCAICGLSCLKKSVLARHIRYRHMTLKPFSCTHEGCDYKGKSKGDLMTHLNKHKVATDEFKCEVFQCEYSSKSAIAYKRHYAKIHLQEPQSYQCHCCEKKYMRGNLLSKHLIRDHQFKLAPGHSRFLYKQDLDGYFRLQTKRIENLREKTIEIVQPKDGSCSYEVADISADQKSFNLTMKRVAKKKVEQKITEKPREVPKKDINDFTVVKNYKNK